MSADLEPYLKHLAVERHLALRTLALYRAALQELQAAADADSVTLRAAQPHHVRRWMAGLRTRGLGSRSIALTLSAWRGLYRWLGQRGELAHNPLDGLRAPKAPKPLPKALSVDQAVALADQRSALPADTCNASFAGAPSRRIASPVTMPCAAAWGACGARYSSDSPA